MFISPTLGTLEFEQVIAQMHKYYEKNKVYETPIQIVIGTDSQNFSDTKIVHVICIYCEGHGGIFFYEIQRQPKVMDVRLKLHIETNDSLRIASELVGIMEDTENYHEMYLNCPISIHIDAGNSPNGKTKELIPELVGWVRSMGYECETKPESFVASTIADRISK